MLCLRLFCRHRAGLHKFSRYRSGAQQFRQQRWPVGQDGVQLGCGQVIVTNSRPTVVVTVGHMSGHMFQEHGTGARGPMRGSTSDAFHAVTRIIRRPR